MLNHEPDRSSQPFGSLELWAPAQSLSQERETWKERSDCKRGDRVGGGGDRDFIHAPLNMEKRKESQQKREQKSDSSLFSPPPLSVGPFPVAAGFAAASSRSEPRY